MAEMKTLSCMNEVIELVKECSGKKYYFRGETEDYGEDACMPSYYRNDASMERVFDTVEHDWLKIKLDALGVGYPWHPSDKRNDDDIISDVAIECSDNFLGICFGDEQLEALKTHYISEFNELKNILPQSNRERGGYIYRSKYLDITSDIMVALHFACSKHCWVVNEDNTPAQSETSKDGYVFILDPEKIETAKYSKLIFHPSYAYFCKRNNKIYYQPFDRITHQHGAFLTAKELSVEHQKLREEIAGLYQKVYIKASLKKELYEIFGKEKGLEYFFPKIPCTFSNEAQEAYSNLKSITRLT